MCSHQNRLIEAILMSIHNIPFSISPKIIRNLQLWVGWLFWAERPFETVFQSISGRSPERGGIKRNDRRGKKMSKQAPPAPTASAVGPCPTIIQISRTPRHWKFTQHNRTTRSPLCNYVIFSKGLKNELKQPW